MNPTTSVPVALAPPSSGRPEPGQLVFEAPRRAKPPQHLADLDPSERKTAVEALGHKGFRAKQLSTHYFERLVESPQEMSDLPKAIRDDLVAGLLPQLLHLQPGWLRNELPVLRHRAGGSDPQHVGRRDRRAGRACRPIVAAR